MKTLLTLIVITPILLFQVVSAQTEQCASGSYEIDRQNNKPICKSDPTGCPYGENIPLDDPKCAPTMKEEIKVYQSPELNLPVVEFGK